MDVLLVNELYERSSSVVLLIGGVTSNGSGVSGGVRIGTFGEPRLTWRDG